MADPNTPQIHEEDPRFAGLQLLACAVVVVDAEGRCLYLNEAAEQIFEASPRLTVGLPWTRLFGHDPAVDELLSAVRRQDYAYQSRDVELQRVARAPLHLNVTVVALDDPAGSLLLECREIDQRLRADREVQQLESANANRELLRNLAHEIKNPLGGIRGAAQLLESELPELALREYTGVIIKEADRLQRLVDRLLAPHRHARRLVSVNIHEVCERVRAVLSAEFPGTLTVVRDYDASLPELPGDREQLIQAVLNLARNAAQAMDGHGVVELRTRVARQVMIARRMCRLALDLHVIDNGPGIPLAIRDRVFFPLVTGREGGSGLGLSLAQTFVQQHGGIIECESRPGCTDFRVLLPLT